MTSTWRLPFASCAGAALGVVLSCGGGGSGALEQGPDGGLLAPDGAPIEVPPAARAAPIPLEQLEEAVIAAVCTPQEACCQAEGIEYVPGACEALLRSRDAGVDGVGLGVPFTTPAGTTYDPQAAGDCLAFYRARIAASNELCKQPVATMAPGQREDEFVIAENIRLSAASGVNLADPSSADACSRIFVGTKPVGAECAAPWECAPPSGSYSFGAAFCSPSKQGSGDGPNVCRYSLFVGEGEPCTSASSDDSRTCVGELRSSDASVAEQELKSFYCDATTNTCKRAGEVEDGQTCGAGTGVRCKLSSFCGSDDRCRPLLAEGEECSNGDTCASGACRESRCAGRVGPGEACEDGASCTTTRCSRVTRTCVPVVAGVARPELCAGRIP